MNAQRQDFPPSASVDDELDRWLEGDHGDSAPRARLARGELVGEWRVEVFLGAGLSAEVYRVTNVRYAQEGALKLLTDESRGLRERFLTEAEAIRYLSLRVLPRFMGSGEFRGSPYYVMEYLHPLEDPMPRREVAGFMNQVAKAVQTLHNVGYIHRDLKPGNILRRRNGEPVLIDLGLIKKRGAGVTDPVVRHGDSISLIDGKPVGVGTLDYAAPEQLLRGEASIRSDIFSLGKILNKLYCFHPPRSVKRIVRRATQAEPGDRYASADEFAAALRHRNFGIYALLLALAAAGIAALLYPVLAPRVQQVQRRIQKSDTQSLAIAHRVGESYGEYVDRLMPVAEAGNVQAQIAVAEAFFFGQGTATNRTAAFEWYLRAAKAGDAGAQGTVGNCLFHGVGCQRDRVAAVKWYTLAADKDDLKSMTDLAYCRMHGLGCDREEDRGYRLALSAAECGWPRAQGLVGECYLEGIGVQPDPVKAELWLTRAARNGDKRAMRLLGKSE